jgi:hypothetical protein
VKARIVAEAVAPALQASALPGGDAVPLLAELLSDPTGDRYPPLTLTPQKRRAKTLQALVAQVEGLAALQPVLLVVEDVHWADPTSLELFDLIVERVAALPLLVIITFRPEFAPRWVGLPRAILISRAWSEQCPRSHRGSHLPVEKTMRADSSIGSGSAHLLRPARFGARLRARRRSDRRTSSIDARSSAAMRVRA